MRKGILGSLAVLTVGAGLTFGQPKSPPPPPGGPNMLPPPGSGSGPVGANGQPYLAPPGFEGMMPPSGPMYGDPGAPDGPYGSGGGLLGGVFGARHGPPRVWAEGDFLFWVPSSFVTRYPIVTTSAPLDLGRVGGLTTASVGPGPQNIAFDAVNGFRGRAGCALDESCQVGIEVGGFWVNPAHRDYIYSSNQLGMPVLAVPFQDVNTGTQASFIVAYPGVSNGAIAVSAQSRIWGAEASVIYNAYGYHDGPGGLTFLAGPRFLQLREQLDVNTMANNIGPIPADAAAVQGSSFFAAGGLPFAGNPGFIPVTVTTGDRIRTTNDFYGAQVGFRGEIGFDKYFVSLTGKVGAGYMRETVELLGGSTGYSVAAGMTSMQPGGIYNLAQENGKHRRDQFSCLAEGGVNVGCQVLSCVRIQAGYTFLWVNHVVRPTRELSPILNPNLIPTSPTFTGTTPANIYPRGITNQTDYHIQGFNVGVELSF